MTVDLTTSDCASPYAAINPANCNAARRGPGVKGTRWWIVKTAVENADSSTKSAHHRCWRVAGVAARAVSHHLKGSALLLAHVACAARSRATLASVHAIT